MSRGEKNKSSQMADYVPRLKGLGLSEEKVAELLTWLFTTDKSGKRCSPDAMLVHSAIEKAEERLERTESQIAMKEVLEVIKVHKHRPRVLVQLVCYQGWDPKEAERVVDLAYVHNSVMRRQAKRASRPATGHQYHRKAHFCA